MKCWMNLLKHLKNNLHFLENTMKGNLIFTLNYVTNLLLLNFNVNFNVVTYLVDEMMMLGYSLKKYIEDWASINGIFLHEKTPIFTIEWEYYLYKSESDYTKWHGSVYGNEISFMRVFMIHGLIRFDLTLYKQHTHNCSLQYGWNESFKFFGNNQIQELSCSTFLVKLKTMLNDFINLK